MANFARELPDATRRLLQENKGIRDLITAKYLDYRIAITQLKRSERIGIPQEYRVLIQQQDEILASLTTKRLIPVSEISDFAAYTRTNSGEAFFWSGMGPNGASKAYEIARLRGGKTLESVLAENWVLMPNWADDRAIWEIASIKYAEQVSGEVRAVIGSSVSPTSIWVTKELPALMNNSNVTRIITIDPETLIERIIK